MPSSAQQSDGNMVCCRMVNGELPASVCKREQGAPECKGCIVSSRRCTACGKTRGIADAERGWCEHCLKQRGELIPRVAAFEGPPDKALEDVLARVRTVGGGNFRGRTAAVDDAFPCPPSMKKDLVKFYPVLMEHGEEHDGTWSVSMPVQILVRRMHLLREEAALVLTKLAAKGKLSGAAPWDEVTLIDTDDIDEIKAKLDNPRAQSQEDKVPRRKHSGAAQNASLPTPATSVTPRIPTKLAAPLSTADLPSMKPLATYAELFAHLISRSSEVRGERLMGGALPALQIRFKLTTDQAKESLEWLQTNGHLLQKDGWRTIALLSTKVESDDGPRKPQATDEWQRRSPGGIKSSTSRTARSAERIAQSEASGGRAVSVAKAPVELPYSFADTLNEVENILPSLREQRDTLALQIAKLEGLCLGLRAAGDPKTLEAAHKLLSSLKK